MSKKNKKQKYPDYLYDVIFAVRNYDDVRLGRREINGETIETLHAKAIKAVMIANNEKGQGYISISKARGVMQETARREKAERLMKEENQSAA